MGGRRAVVGPGLDGLRVPKVESAETVRLVENWTNANVPLVCNIESAAGVWAAREIASVRVPTRPEGRGTVPADVSMAEIDRALRARGGLTRS